MLLPTILLFLAVSDPLQVLESASSSTEFALSANPDSKEWTAAPRVQLSRDYLGQPLPGPPSEVRSRWTKQHLYLLFLCPYGELNLKPDPDPSQETPRLWNWDVGEAFIGADFEHITRYKEFQVSPQGEWVDLDIDREHPLPEGGMGWNSGYAVKARIDAAHKIWYGEMRIPFRALDTDSPSRPAPQPGQEWRIGLYRIAGTSPHRQYYAWRPTGQANFHVPQAFGRLRLR